MRAMLIVSLLSASMFVIIRTMLYHGGLLNPRSDRSNHKENDLRKSRNVKNEQSREELGGLYPALMGHLELRNSQLRAIFHIDC
jgi:hypothetical protein